MKFGRGDLGNLAFLFAFRIFLDVLPAVAVYYRSAINGERVYHRGAYAVKSSRDLVGAFFSAKFSTSVERRHDRFQR